MDHIAFVYLFCLFVCFFFCGTIFRKDFTFSRYPVMCSTRRGKYYGLWRCWETAKSSKMAAKMNFTAIGFYSKLGIIKNGRNLVLFVLDR